MNFFDVVGARHSTREFSSRKIHQATLATILNTASSAPSAGNLQSYQIVVVRNGKHKAALAKAAYGQDFVAEAPVVLVFCADPQLDTAKYGRRGAELFCIQDATLAAGYAQLATAALGLASVWVGAFDEKKVGEIVGGLKPICILPIGYPAGVPEVTQRRPLDDLVH